MYLSKQEIITFEAHIDAEYSFLAGRGMSRGEPYQVPHIHTWIKESYRSINHEHKSNAIMEAIDKGMYEKLGMSKSQFVKKAEKMEIDYIKEDQIPINDVMLLIIQFARQYHVSYTDYNDDLINSPIGGGLW